MKRTKPPFSDVDVREPLERAHSSDYDNGPEQYSGPELMEMTIDALCADPNQYHRVVHEHAREHAEKVVQTDFERRLKEDRLERRANSPICKALGWLSLRFGKAS